MTIEKNFTPLRTALRYVLFGFLWILLSDTALELFTAPGSPVHLWIQTAKGWLFVLISAGLIYFMLKIDIKSLATSQERYRAIFNSSLDAVMLTLPSGEILAVNPAGCHMFDQTEEEIKRIGRSGIVDATDPRLALALEERKRTGKFKGELTFIRKNGEKFPVDVSSSVFKDKDGNLRTSMIIRDITERKRAEDLLRESEQKLQDVFKVMEEGMALNEFIFDEAGEIMDYRILEVNPAFERIAMLTREQVVGRTATDIYQMSSEFIHDFWKKNLGTSQSIRTEYYVPEINQWRHISTSQPLNNKFATVFIDMTEQKMAELALRESETNLRAIWENSTQSFMLIDPDRQVRKMNHVALEQEQAIFGRPIQPGGSIYDIVQPKERPWFDQTFEKVLAGESLQFERSFNPGGIQHWYEYRLSPVRTDNGENLGVFLVTTDITERKQAEAALRKSEVRYRTLVENSPYCIHEIDLEGRLLSMNPSGLKMMCVEDESEIRFMPYLDAVSEADRSRIGNLLELAVQGQSSEFEYTSANGSIFQSSFVPIKDSNDQVTLIAGLTQDVTERKQTEAAFQTQTERLNLATRYAHIGIWDWDIQNDRLEWDDQMFNLYGINLEQSLHAYEAWLNGIHPDDREYSDEVSRQAVRGEIEYDTEFRVVWLDGSVHWLKADGQVFRDPNGKAVRMVGLNYDITERKLAEEKIREEDIQFRKLSANVPDLIFHIRAAGWNLSCSPIQ
ncbi:MAG: PAS domain S-box protein [Anaerolineales bacterium]|nr:PAS domain S-box protein [Anaerolineales bacterium]